MKTYTFFFFSDRQIPSFDIAACANDDEARHQVPRLALSRPDCRSVEVWDEAKLVCREPAPRGAGTAG